MGNDQRIIKLVGCITFLLVIGTANGDIIEQAGTAMRFNVVLSACPNRRCPGLYARNSPSSNHICFSLFTPQLLITTMQPQLFQIFLTPSGSHNTNQENVW